MAGTSFKQGARAGIKQTARIYVYGALGIGALVGVLVVFNGVAEFVEYVPG